MPQNPFDRGYAAIYTAWQQWPPLMALVKVNNFQNLQTPGYNPRKGVNAGDRPELRVGESAFGLRPFSVNSRAGDYTMLYPVHVLSGQLGISKINLLVWEIGRALAKAGSQLSLPELLKWDLSGDASIRNRDPVAQRPEWTAIATVRMEFKIDLAQLLSDTYT